VSSLRYGAREVAFDAAPDGAQPTLLFTENETNQARLFGVPNTIPFVKDAFDDYVVHGRHEAVNPALEGTKAAAFYRLEVPAGGTVTIRARFAQASGRVSPPFADFDATVEARRAEADEFYAGIIPASLSEDGARVMRQSLAGMLWSKQF